MLAPALRRAPPAPDTARGHGMAVPAQAGTDGKLLLRALNLAVASNTPFHVSFCYVCA